MLHPRPPAQDLFNLLKGARRPHYHVHFTPTSASWINQVERWFAELTRKQLQRGVQRSTGQLEADILTFIERHKESPKPYSVLTFCTAPCICPDIEAYAA